MVFDFHGLIEGARIHSLATQMGAYGDTMGFVTVFPQGTGDPAFWNATKVDGVVDDMAYTKDMIASVKASVCVDGARIYASGLSDGAFMVSRLACDMADTFAAVAPVAGVNTMEGSCTPTRAVPVIAIHGTDDKFVAYGGNGGSSAASLGVTADSVATLLMLKLGPVPDTAAAWAKRNGCAEGPTDTPIGDDVVKRSWTKCDGGADVMLLTVNGGGHTWPGSAFFANVAKIVGRTTETIDANEQMWDFFKAHPLKIQ